MWRARAPRSVAAAGCMSTRTRTGRSGSAGRRRPSWPAPSCSSQLGARRPGVREDRCMPSADYVIVGAGSAGCVLANRLTEDPDVSVLLIEAGRRDRSPNIKIPAAFANQFHTKLDWDFATEPEPHCDGRSLYIPRGRSLGGSSSMNAMLYVRGRPLDYDGWAARGAEGWGWRDVLPYFVRAEGNVRGGSEL